MQQTDHKLVEKADEHFRNGRVVQAEKLYKRILRDADDSPAHVLMMLGFCRRHHKDADGALAYFRDAVRHGDNEAQYHYCLGRQLIETRNTDEGREALAQAIALYPNHAPARTLLGFSWFQDGDLERAEKELRSAHRSDERYVPACIDLALVLLRKGDLDAGEGMALKAVQLQPHNAGAQLMLGQVYLAKGHVGFAEQTFRNALEQHPDNPEVLAKLAIARWHAGAPAEAAEQFATIAGRGYRPPEMMHDFARCLLDTGRADQARAILDDLVRHGVSEPDVVLTLAEAVFASGDVVATRAVLAEVPGDSSRKSLLEAFCLNAEGDREGARRQFEVLANEGGKRGRLARLEAAGMALRDDDDAAAARLLEPLLSDGRYDRQALFLEVERLGHGGTWQAAADMLATKLKEESIPEHHRAYWQSQRVSLLDRAGEYAAAGALLDEAAWQTPSFIQQFESKPHQEAARAWLSAPEDSFAEIQARVPRDGRRAPLWLMGWPGAGRGLLSVALSAHSSVRALDAEGITRRLNALEFPLRPDEVSGLDESRLAGWRQAYFGRDDEEEAGVTLETGWPTVLALPSLAAAFPGARVVVLVAAEEDLHFHWRISGFRQSDAMLSAYRSDRELFTALRDLLPLEMTLIARHRLFGEPEQVLGSIFEALDMPYEESCLEAFRRETSRRHLWPDGHWRHYAEVLGRD